MTGITSPCLEEAEQIIRAHEIGAELDAGFDAGEFSGPAHDQMLCSALTELATRYDVDVDELRSLVDHHRAMSHDEMAGWSDSQEMYEDKGQKP